ncbi:unnamed protein product [Schistocephalus solidus]|uniref:Endonuclease/exonuclease/phosphatase domain-containing protein n=1 Tax=Schistocephalus solidus TaxID=70667 RepID=A0A183THE4_SCHSO|nr:unnamed protein product [Schistocephalus solidus]
MLLLSHLTCAELSPVAPRSWLLPNGHTPCNRHDQRAKPGDGLRCCACLNTRRKTQTNNNHRRPHPPRHTLQSGRVSPLTLEAWNVRSLLDTPRSNRLVTWELARYKVDIAALSGTRFSEQGQLEEVGAGYTFFWSGQPNAVRRDARIAIAIWNDIVGRLPCLPQ